MQEVGGRNSVLQLKEPCVPKLSIVFQILKLN